MSNLSFLSKILEKIVAKRLNARIEEQLLSNHVQSAYKHFNSTETAIIKIHNDIICSVDNGKVTALTLFPDNTKRSARCRPDIGKCRPRHRPDVGKIYRADIGKCRLISGRIHVCTWARCRPDVVNDIRPTSGRYRVDIGSKSENRRGSMSTRYRQTSAMTSA